MHLLIDHLDFGDIIYIFSQYSSYPPVHKPFSARFCTGYGRTFIGQEPPATQAPPMRFRKSAVTHAARSPPVVYKVYKMRIA